MTSKIPLEMAACARDKIQASARDLWASIRNLDELARKPATEDSDSPTSEGAASASLEKIESVFKILFGSCTAPPSPPPPPRTTSLRSGEFISQKDIGDHVYAQLFMDDQARATRVVDGLREQETRQKAESSPKSPSKQSLNPFPVSSPPRKNGPPVLGIQRPTTKAVDVGDDLSFDDDISAISAHTLEEMARVHEHKTMTQSKCGFSSQRHANVEEISYPLSSRSRRSGGDTPRDQNLPPVPAIMSPLIFSREVAAMERMAPRALGRAEIQSQLVQRKILNLPMSGKKKSANTGMVWWSKIRKAS
jgi:hypothetical protein